MAQGGGNLCCGAGLRQPVRCGAVTGHVFGPFLKSEQSAESPDRPSARLSGNGQLRLALLRAFKPEHGHGMRINNAPLANLGRLRFNTNPPFSEVDFLPRCPFRFLGAKTGKCCQHEPGESTGAFRVQPFQALPGLLNRQDCRWVFVDFNRFKPVARIVGAVGAAHGKSEQRGQPGTNRLAVWR